MRDANHGDSALGEALHHLEDLVDHLGIKRTGRFVEQDDLGLHHERATAFTQTHDCLYMLMEWLRVRQTSGMPDVEEVEAQFEEIWKADGLGDRTSAAEYRRLASRIIGALVKAGGGVRFKEGKPIALDLRAGRVVVEPNAIAELDNGTVVRSSTGSLIMSTFWR